MAWRLHANSEVKQSVGTTAGSGIQTGQGRSATKEQQFKEYQVRLRSFKSPLLALLGGLIEKLRPAEFLQFVHGTLLPCESIGDQRFFQLRVVSRQKAATFRSSTAAAEAFRRFDLCLSVHVTIKILASIPLQPTIPPLAFRG